MCCGSWRLSGNLRRNTVYNETCDLSWYMFRGEGISAMYNTCSPRNVSIKWCPHVSDAVLSATCISYLDALTLGFFVPFLLRPNCIPMDQCKWQGSSSWHCTVPLLATRCRMFTNNKSPSSWIRSCSSLSLPRALVEMNLTLKRMPAPSCGGGPLFCCIFSYSSINGSLLFSRFCWRQERLGP